MLTFKVAVASLSFKIASLFLPLLFQSEQYIHNMMDMVHNQKYLPAIYTHCYDTSGTRLFAAGGPLQFNLKGNYIALFQ